MTPVDLRLTAFDRARQMHPSLSLDELLPIASRIADFLAGKSQPVLTASVTFVFAAPEKGRAH